jgi:hypothetical protein
LIEIFACTSLSCVQLHIEFFNITVEVAHLLGLGIAKLTNLQSLFFEGNRGNEVSYAILFHSLRGKLPNVRHLSLPNLIEHHNTPQYHCVSFHLKKLLVNCAKLVYFDISYRHFAPCAIKRLLDICVLNKSIQVLCIQHLSTNMGFLSQMIQQRLSSGCMPLLDIVFGDKYNCWTHPKNERMNLFFCLNKEKRERRPLLQCLHTHSFEYAILPYVLSALGKKQAGFNDIYQLLREDENSLLKLIVNQPAGKAQT